MPKQTFTLNDFSGGANGYVDPLDIADNELAQCKGFKLEPGVVSVIGDMKGAYSPASANGSDSIVIESGYGFFAFSSDYNASDPPVIADTNYIILMDGVTFDMYGPSSWVAPAVNLGTH